MALPTDLSSDWNAIASPALHAAGHARATFARLRRQRAVGWTSMGDGQGFWSVLRYREIFSAAKNPRVFSSAREWGGHRIYEERDDELTRKLDASMLSMDPPEHTTHRALVAPAFGVDNVRALEESIRARVGALIDEVGPRGECDFVSSLAAELPIQVLADLLGIPQEDRARLIEWSNAFAFPEDETMRRSPEHFAQCVQDMLDYCRRQWRDRVRRPRNDLISMLVHSDVDGEPLAMSRFLATLGMLVIAGNDTTKNAMSGGLVALSENPEQRRLLLEDPSLIPAAAKEMVRWVSPVLHMRRTATEDTILGEQRIQRGDKVVLWFVSGNFDEEVFPGADRFDVKREGPAHLGFGVGPHFCLGRRLAELELTLFFEALLRRLPDIEVCGPVVRVRSNFLNGIRSMPVRFTKTT